MPSGSQRSIGLHLVWLPIQRAARPAAADQAIERKVEEDLLGDADRGFVGLAARDRHLQAESRVDRGQLGGARLAQLPDRGQADGLQLFEQRRGVRTDTRLGEHPDRPHPLPLGDREGCRGLHDRHVVDRHHEEGSAHGQHAQDAPLLVQLVVDPGGRRRRHPRPRLEEGARRIGRVQHHERRRGLGDGRDLRAGSQSMPQADPSATLFGPDAASRSHAPTIARGRGHQVVSNPGSWLGLKD